MGYLKYKGSIYTAADTGKKCEMCGEDMDREGTLCKKCLKTDEQESHQHLYRDRKRK